MIFGTLAIFFNVLSIMGFCVLFIIFTLSIIVSWKSETFNQYSVVSRRRVLWFIAVSPWLFGCLAASLVILSGSHYSPFPQSFDLLHWHHAQEFIFNSWHGLSIIALVVYTGFLFFRKVYSLIINSRQISLLQAVAERDENGFYRLEADAATAFTAGYLMPRCYITTALRRQLNSKEYTILQLHEKEHVRRADPLMKWCFQLFTAFFPTVISVKLNQSMSLVMEQCADFAVSDKISDKLLIAETLLKVRRLAVRPFEGELSASAVCHYGHDHIEERISYLLSDQQSKVFPILIFIFATVSISIFSALTVDIFHHTIEYTLSH
jgi:hypothetical protein